MELGIYRFLYTPFGTLAWFGLDDDDGLPLVEGYTIELPWRDNEQNRSCIPTGVYPANRHESPKFGETVWVRDVPERSEILLHVANSPADLDGCVGPGDGYGWWPDREEFAVWNSQDTLEQILAGMEDELRVRITDWEPLNG